MVQGVSRALWASGCVNCRLSVLRIFTTISGIPWHPTQLQRQSSCLKGTFKQQTRLSSGTHQHITTLSKDVAGEETPLSGDGDALGAHETGSEATNSLQSTQLPWYLQVEAPLRPPQTLSERQRIPELPESPPEMLQPLLKHISIDLGLDDLTLLDLRNLDPPPALGANLLMIIGTARSEKHLHVSADRLCRWLRSEYKLRPDADGLLGRNELKLKMKRKNRRAKLLGSRADDADLDDGVRTGWVCVNVGTVESTADKWKVHLEKKNFVGFGRQTEGVKIVVQMLIEEKREELGLERLWNGITKRQLSMEAESAEDSPDAAEKHSDVLQTDPIKSPRISTGVNYSPQVTSFSPMSGQSRGIHTSSRWCFPASEMLSSALTSSAATASPFNQSRYSNFASIDKDVASAVNSGDYSAARRLLIDNNISIPELQNDGWRTYLFDCLRRHMESLPSAEVRKELGQGFTDYNSTPFLSCVYQTISSFPSMLQWEFLVWLHWFARRVGHSGYTSEGLFLLFEQLQFSGVPISNNTYLRILQSTLRPRDDFHGGLNRLPQNADLERAVRVLQDMYVRTGHILTEDLFVTLQECIAIFREAGFDISNATNETYGLPVQKRSALHSRLNALMSTVPIRITRDESRIRLLNVYAKQYDWDAFWQLWRSIAREGNSRSAALYACMFQRVAETNHQKGCINVLRTWMDEMDREEPQVKLEGEVLTAVQACLAVVDIREVEGEWSNLRQRCRDASS